MSGVRGGNPATQVPTIRDLEWAAGFLEGEGCFSSRNSEKVQVAQVSSEPLSRLKKIFGGHINYLPGRGNSRDYFTWSVSGSRARGVMLTLYSLLSGRRQRQIETALAFNPGPLQFNYT